LTATRVGRNQPVRVTRDGTHAASIHPVNYAWPYASSMRGSITADPTPSCLPDGPAEVS
jgi:hypothetical protein